MASNQIVTVLLGGTLDTVEIGGQKIIGGGRFLFRGRKTDFKSRKDEFLQARRELTGSVVVTDVEVAKKLPVGVYFLPYQGGVIDEAISSCSGLIDSGTSDGRDEIDRF